MSQWSLDSAVSSTEPNPEQFALAKRGTAAWNSWKRENPGVGVYLWYADLKKVDLTYGFLSGARFDNSQLSQSTFRYARLHEADFHGASLDNADFFQAILNNASFVSADLRNADFREAHLYGADLSDADLSGADLRNAELFGARLVGADLSNADLRGASLIATSLVGTNVEEADFSKSKIYGLSAWDLKGSPKDQTNLILTRNEEEVITVDDLKVAQFLHLILFNPELRNAIDTITSKVVLILGRFSEKGLRTLDALRSALRQRNYIPVLFDFDAPKSRDVEETVSTLAHMARFIIADITEPKAIPQELSVIVRNLQSVPVLPLLHESQKPWGMFTAISRRSSVLPILIYANESELIEKIQSDVIDVAERKAREFMP